MLLKHPVSNALDAALLDKIDNKTKPLGSLGQLEKIAFRIGRIQNTLSPMLNNPCADFTGVHGAAHSGTSAYPQDVSWQMVENYLQGGAGANVVLAPARTQNGGHVDAGVAHEFGEREA